MKTKLNIILVIIIAVMIFYVIDCTKARYQNIDSIIKNAYKFIPDDTKGTIKDWEYAEVSNFKATSDMNISEFHSDKTININNIDTIKVTFSVPNSLLGDITVYINKKTGKVIGIQSRE
jgi:hypothetical protein